MEKRGGFLILYVLYCGTVEAEPNSKVGKTSRVNKVRDTHVLNFVSWNWNHYFVISVFGQLTIRRQSSERYGIKVVFDALW